MNAATRKVINVGYGLALAVLAANAVLAYLDIRAIVRGNWWVEHTREVVAQLERAASSLKDAETGQRGYLLTGKDEYLRPYVDASNGLDKELDRLVALTADNPDQQARLAELRRIAGEKIAELGRTVALMRKGDRDAALAVVQTDRGRALMDRARTLVAEMRAEEDRLLTQRSAASHNAAWRAVASVVVATAIVASALLLVSHLKRREDAEKGRAAEALRESEEWLVRMMESIGDGVVATDGRGRVRLMNPVAQQLTGWTQAEAVGRPIEEVFVIVNEETRQPAENPVFRAIREGVVMGLANHTVLIARGGAETSIDDSAAPIKGKDGNVIGVVMVFQDATERRRHEAGLRASNERHRAILESITDAFYAFDRDWRFTYVNRRAEAFMGRSREELLGKDVWDLYPDAIGSDFHVAFRRAMDERAVVTFEAFYPPHDRWYELHAYPSEDGISVYFRDIGERKRAEEEKARLTAASEQQRRIYETALSNSPDFNYIFDLEGRFAYVNATLLDLWQKRLDEAVGRDFFDLGYPPELAARLQRQIRQVIETRQSVRDETPYTSHLGERQYEYIFVPVLGAGGEVEAVAGSTRDVTERRRQERELQASSQFLASSIDALTAHIAVIDEEGVILMVNQAWRLFATGNAYALGECGVGTDYLAASDGDGEDHCLGRRAAAGIREVLGGRTVSFEMEYPCHGPDEKRWFLMRATRFESAGAVRAVIAHENITERKRAEEQLRAAKEEAEDANRAKDDFLAVLSHELRTPLNPILLATTAMIDRPTPPEEFHPTLEMIRQNVNLQARLIDDLLDVMRIVRGKMPLHWGVSDCHDLIGRAVEITRSDALGKNHRLVLDLIAEDRCVNADAARLQQVFWNLLKNAIKFTPEGGTITIRTRNEGESILIEVADTGIGIEPDILPHVFDAFHQGDTRITRKFGGLGLGLAICRGVVEAHGGTIAAESGGKDRGTTFRVALKTMPVPEDVPNCGDEGDGKNGSAPAASLNRLNILAVDDEPTTLRLMARLLGGLGHRVETAGSVADAWEKFQVADGFDLIISDIGLPDGSGLDLMRKVKAVRFVPAIALTGYGMDEDIRRSREAGFTTHMTKPIDFTKLEAMIRQVAN